MSARKWLFVAGCCLSAAFLAAILWRLDWPVFVAEFRRLRYAWLALTVMLIIFGMALRALRWNLAAGAQLRAYPAFWNAAVIGLMLNQVYPLRAGEIVRIFALRQMAGIPLGRAATSALVDRLADALLLGICAVAVVAAHTGVPYAERLAAGALMVACAALAALIIFAKGDHIWRSWSSRWSAKISAGLQKRIGRFYAGAVETAALIASPLQLMRIVAITAAAFAIDFAIMFSAIKAFGWDLPLIAPVTVLVFLAVGTSLPSAPGYAGVYQIACVLALALFGINESPAVAYSIVVQVCVLATIASLAGLAAASHRDELRSVRSALAKNR
jgi:uncharacterized protein (TIRG00374 family)